MRWHRTLPRGHLLQDTLSRAFPSHPTPSPAGLFHPQGGLLATLP